MQLRIVLQRVAGLAQSNAIEPDGELVAIELGAGYSSGVPRQQGRHFGAVFQLLDIGDCRLQSPCQIFSALPCLFQSSTPFFQTYQKPASTIPMYTSISQNQNMPRPVSLSEMDNGPGIEEDGFHVEQDEQHGHQIKLDGKALAGVAHRLHAAFVRRHLGLVVLVLADEPGERHNSGGDASGYENMDQQRQIAGKIKVRHDGAKHSESRAEAGKHSSLEFDCGPCQPRDVSIHQGYKRKFQVSGFKFQGLKGGVGDCELGA